MNKQNQFTGYLLVLAAITFWISWFLMPDPGTTDTQYILKAVKEARLNVLCSVIIQIISSVLYIVALVSLATLNLGKQRITLAGISLFGIGIMGLCADAFFHLLAYLMTDDSITIQQDVISVMEFMQTTGVIFLIPLLLPLFIGSLAMATGLQKKVLFAKTATVLFITAFAVATIGGISTNAFNYTIPGLSTIVLAIFACGQALIGIGLVRLRGSIEQQETGKREKNITQIFA